MKRWLIAVSIVLLLVLIPSGAQALDRPASRAIQLQLLLDSATRLDAIAWSARRNGNLLGCRAAVTIDYWVRNLYTWRFRGEILDSRAC